MRNLIVISICFWICLISVQGFAAELTGKDILQQVDQVLTAESREMEISLRIINNDGQQRVREIKVWSKGQDNALIKFLAPADVEGTAFLVSRDEAGGGGMWLYMPVLGTVRRIASHMRNGSFMGTDFTYNEIGMIDGSKYEDKYSSKLLGIEEYAGEECYLLIAESIEADSDYSRLKMWVRREDYIPVKLEIYDVEGNLFKIMTNAQITLVDGYRTPMTIQMENVQTGSKTILEIKKVKFDLEIPDEIFTTRYLERG